MKPFEETTHVFIVRIWEEPREGGNPKREWRGMIENVATQERSFFRDFNKLLAFIRERTGISDGEDE